MNKRHTRNPREPFFPIFLVFVGIILLTGCHGFKFTSGMFNFEASGHTDHPSITNDTNASDGIE